ncbi:hypothetical protein CFIMG_007961RA00001 [Ceratocystis fimbriata CBS 114723]|uniref:NF-kappa-B inhibitor-like protein 1 n=1 Tax=Ceratocystis fimbriata CBS 114723 TaxID=1035309 RepID=A0A2C5XBB6_9PEZI|nr:hypothetical protein CFIMG_007961RA00001 [Ceratocystis fimbriata CBS 114723]
MDQSLSPKRRHILSSFNPEADPARRLPADHKHYEPKHNSTSTQDHSTDRQRRRRRYSSEQDKHRCSDGPQEDRKPPDDGTKPHTKKLRLKGEGSRRRQRRRHEDDEKDSKHRDQDRHRSYRKSHGHRRRRHSRSPTPENPHQEPSLDPDAAFRESLFDALADDEGAAYWEGVYGQPLHVYGDPRQHNSSNISEGMGSGLESMTDEEYAAWVREQMWAKTHQGLLEERARRDAARAEQAARRQDDARRRREDRKLQREVERSLQAGEERRKRRTRREVWQSYLGAWSRWDGSVDTIPWPGGAQPLAGEEAVRKFFVQALEEEVEGAERDKALKEERVRWHPDKIQQRLGGEVAAEVMSGVTMIFQVLDRLWGESRQSK